MYSTCLFCHSPLGRNEAVEHFPVGRRLAFDATHGRLWVVCRQCERWNLTPLDERWEAIEECERAFRATRLRVSTEHIGLCRLREGTELVRIGEALRPELAAWRYGDQFNRRRRKYVVMSTAAIGVPLVYTGATIVAHSGIAGMITGFGYSLYCVASLVRDHRAIARVPTPEGVARLRYASLLRVTLRPSRDHWWELQVPTGTVIDRFSPWRESVAPMVPLHGDAALRAARIILPHLNVAGGTDAVVRNAVDLLDPSVDISLAFARAASSSISRYVTLSSFPAAQRLALEMALNEDDERRVLEGELAQLEARWREAEEIAAISDALLVPDRVTAAIEATRGGNA